MILTTVYDQVHLGVHEDGDCVVFGKDYTCNTIKAKDRTKD